ncbi:MAG: 3-phosphoshikimate 1-carboxyvinyltransferase [Salinimicrobium sp.]
MDLQLSAGLKKHSGKVVVTGSKSESNRLLILQALFPQLEITNLSNSDDTRVLQKALSSIEEVVDVHHAGTAMRFLTAYFATREGRRVVLTGSSRMQERPVKVLVEALRALGADISYLKNEGYPPLKIEGKKITQQEVSVQANISSQYISALMLIAPSLPNGLKIILQGNATSVPYILMTLKLLEGCGIQGRFQDNIIQIPPAEEIPSVALTVESDWSSASYFYSIAAMSEEAEFKLSSYREDSLQGDRSVAEIYRKLGVKTTFVEDKVLLQKEEVPKMTFLELDLSGSPDLAQTIAVTCLGLGIRCKITGLHTLRIKETDRLQALKNEMEKFGGSVAISEDTLEFSPSEKLKTGIKIETYNDHRMALAFAALATKVQLEILEAEVVSKSFPGYWEELEKVGFSVKNLQKD